MIELTYHRLRNTVLRCIKGRKERRERIEIAFDAKFIS